MKQHDLFPLPAMSRTTDPESSKSAALRQVRSGQRASESTLILAVLLEHRFWMPASQIAYRIHRKPYEVRKRLPELLRQGLVNKRLLEGAREQEWRANPALTSQ